MSQKIEKAMLIPVKPSSDTPDMKNAVKVQFNPSTLKVALSNTLKAGKRGKSKKSTQYVDKSSSNLAVELIFDTSLEGKDVRKVTMEIPTKFMDTKGKGKKMKAPNRCRFQWGSFAFVGVMQSYDENLDFFSPDGFPLRATASIKLTEDKFSYKFADKKQAAAESKQPTLTPTGTSGEGDERYQPRPPAKPMPSVNEESGMNGKDWRDTALYNGVESPRFPLGPVLAVPGLSMEASAGMGVTAKAEMAAPGFSYGASASLGTGISGAFETGKGGGARLKINGSVK
jgi:hypothetical protein